MINRFMMSTLLALLLLFGQQAAMLHPYDHTEDWQPTSSDTKHPSANSKTCEKCLALADIVNSVVSYTYLVNLLMGSFELKEKIHQSLAGTCLVFYHSRAPPALN